MGVLYSENDILLDNLKPSTLFDVIYKMRLCVFHFLYIYSLKKESKISVNKYRATAAPTTSEGNLILYSQPSPLAC